ncbi:MAG TPA: NUDIX domain-containing protein [Symbiobacteriaceae bacterium]|nr:NUDIX domain-containing protein [Symbiobacteriaceae bacterium]
MRQKVQAYITRETPSGLQLLVFEHADFPDAGIQVPAGSIDPGETPDHAVLRETLEEAGLTDVTIIKYVGCFPWFYPAQQVIHQRHVYHLAVTKPVPDRWEQVVSGGVEDKGMRFICYWMDLPSAATALSGQQGMYLSLL